MTKRSYRDSRSLRLLWALSLGTVLSLLAGSATAGEIYGRITERGGDVRVGTVVAVVGPERTNETRTEANGNYRLVFDYPSGSRPLKDQPALWIRSGTRPPSVRIHPRLANARIHANWTLAAATGSPLSAAGPIVAVVETGGTSSRFYCELRTVEGGILALEPR